ncbi:tRNA-dihydrouridine(47) synthase [NAD(P)(+)]-like [Venturia canescens]|uniref:tRNA-dihydrouridine(47) synthase [NAD(P)(+)]-like n=1 Tax=Venturia canescens TaxID=32260 RepID=UPI001C9CC6E3|nr:tRNA-dihydrouridine(47) synthase [NAD(P)(+)]-like [Venturia canescens]
MNYIDMADCSENSTTQCSSDYSEDKQKGICRIKPEFIVTDHVRQLTEECLTQDDKCKVLDQTKDPKEVNNSDEPPVKKKKYEDKKDKLRGQNKARPPPFKAPREENLCPWVVDQAKEEPEKKCQNPRCTFMHDRAAYLKIKAEDVGPECCLFNLSGRCPRGVACRVGKKHLTEDGYNIVDKEKHMEYEKKPASTKNQISKELQNRLRKHKYNFTRAEKIVKANDLSKKKTQMTNQKESITGNGDNQTESELIAKDGTSNASVQPVAKINDFIPSNESSINRETLNDIPSVERTKNGVPSHQDSTKTELPVVSNAEKEARIGSVPDHDLIRLRSCEKKKIEWRDKILLSPLTTVGNLPFRRICKEYGADITCGEMALAPKILKGAHEEWALVKRHESEDIFGVQVCGNNPGVLARCAQLLNDEADVNYIDLNLGCPIDLIYRQGGGSGMLNRLNILENVVKSMSEVIDIPLTIKTRMGVYMDKPVAHNLVSKFRDWGASMITVHGRSREQRYTKSADWEYIEKCATAASPIPVFGNGDILSYDDYANLRNTYKTIQGVTIGRGALIKPWLFTEIKENKLMDVRSNERFDILKKYVNYGLEHWGSDTRGVETTRRFMLEWISFLHRYIPVGILENPPQKINERPPYYVGRDDMETLMASSNCADWIKISEMLLGKVPDGFHFLPKHKANSWK